MSLRRKILLYAVVPVSIVMVIVLAIVLLQMRGRMIDAARGRIGLELLTAAQVIEQGNQEAVHMARSMAEAQEHGFFGRRRQSVELARRVLEDNPQFIGAYFGYDPNADGGDREWLGRAGAEDGSADEQGRFLPYWFRAPDAGGEVTLEALVEMESSLYYQGMKDKYLGGGSERFIITEPYLYNGQNLIIEQTSPIVIDGEFVGIAGVDRGLDFLDEFVAALKPYQTANLTLISGRGGIIATTFGAQIGHDLRTLAVDELYLNPDGSFPADLYRTVDGKLMLNREEAAAERIGRLSSHIKDQTAELTGARDGSEVRRLESLTGGDVLGAAARIPTGDWTLVVSVPLDEIMAPIQGTIRGIGLLALLGVIASVGLLVVVTNQIVRRIESVAILAREVADGDLTGEVDIECRDETGQLQASVRDMMASLNGLVGKVRSSTSQLSLTATEIFVAARQQEGAVNEFGSSTTGIAAAAREIAATADELMGAMDDTGKVAGETGSLAASSRSGLEAMASTMGAIKESAASIRARLEKINEKASGIGVAVTTISRVADRTNMLSLNASIEAEKAGEYRSGFSVVAREANRLAEQTAAATLDISEIVKEMQSAVAAGVTEMDGFVAQVDEGVLDVRRVGGQLREIIERVQALTSRFTGVAEGMKSQSEGARQIRDAIAGLSGSVEQTGRTLNDFRRASDHLQESVADLRNEVARFRVRGDAESQGDGQPGGAAA